VSSRKETLLASIVLCGESFGNIMLANIIFFIDFRLYYLSVFGLPRKQSIVDHGISISLLLPTGMILCSHNFDLHISLFLN